MMNNSSVTSILGVFDGVTNKPETFISSKETLTNEIRQLLKQTYDFTKTEEPKSTKSNTLPELIIQDFDLEQIWQQIELQNDHTLNKSITLVSKLAVAKDKLTFSNGAAESDLSSDEDDAEHDESPTDAEAVPENGDIVGLDNEDHGSEEDDDNNEEKESPRKKFKPSAVDDEFFKLDEMNNFLVSEEKKLNKPNKEASDSESEESVDLFKGNDEDDAAEEEDFEGNDKLRNPRYKDFFGTKTQQRMERERRMIPNSGDETDQSDDGDGQNENEHESEHDVTAPTEDAVKSNKSTLELREERLKRKIEQMEKVAISEKPWQLKGEVTAESRPQNSLLQEVLEFDLTSRPAPVITEATTRVLEDVIRQRIKDKAFDDVERKEKPVDTPLEYKKKLMLDQEKSKESLAQIYEKEFIAQREALQQNGEEKEEEEPELHKEIKTMMHSLFTKLDALSNFHFTPKPAAPELKVVSNLPAINMEEVAPVAASDAALLAPEEVKAKTKGDIIGKGERTSTDKKRERRQKRQRQRKHANEKRKKENTVNKMKPGLGNKYSKEKAKKMLDNITKETNVDKMDESVGAKSVKSSSAFFTQLQEEVTSHIKNKTKMSKNKTKKHFDAKRMKL